MNKRQKKKQLKKKRKMGRILIPDEFFLLNEPFIEIPETIDRSQGATLSIAIQSLSDFEMESDDLKSKYENAKLKRDNKLL